MANTLTNVLPTILARGVLALRQNAIVPRFMTRDYEAAAQGYGNVVNVPIPSAITARAVSPDISFNSNVNSAPTVALITLDHWYEAPFFLTDNDALSAQGLIPMQASEAVKAIGNDADAFAWGKHVGFYAAVGAAGTTPFASGVTNAVSARTALNKTLCPPDGRWGLLDPSAEANLLSAANVLQFDQRGDQGGIISGSIGTKLGFTWYMDQNITTYTPGTGWATGYVLSTVSGPLASTTLNIINATASGTVLIGDIFTVAGGSQQYVIKAVATAAATTQFAISFYPALATAVAIGVAITVVGTAYTANLVGHTNAWAWASRPLLSSQASYGNVFQAETDPLTGIALRLELSRQFKQDTYSFDYLAGAGVVRRELGAKILG